MDRKRSIAHFFDPPLMSGPLETPEPPRPSGVFQRIGLALILASFMAISAAVASQTSAESTYLAILGAAALVGAGAAFSAAGRNDG